MLALSYATQEQQILDAYTPVLNQAMPHLKRHGTFLEIGGGSGFMLQYAAERGFSEMIELEPSADAERRFTPPSAKARFIRGVFTRGMVPKESVSLACFFQMLDHVPGPVAFLEEVERVLEPGGVAVCVTHNTRAVSARLLGERSPIVDIEHTYLFHPGNLPKLMEKVGLETRAAFPISNPYSLRYWLKLAPLPRPLKSVAGKVMELTGLAQVRIPLRAGNFAVIAQKPLVVGDGAKA